MTTIGVLLPLPPGGPPLSPGDSPLGQAAAQLSREGVRVVFGSKLENGSIFGFQARELSWVPVQTRIKGLYDNWPSYIQQDAWRRMLAQAGEKTHIANPVAFTESCGDRLAMQRMLEMCGVQMTPIEAKAKGFRRALAGWGTAFLKPRNRGSFTRVRHISSEEELPTPDQTEPMVLQKSHGAPSGWGGMVVRALCQREITGDWVFPTPVAFRSMADHVAGGAKDAVVDPAERALPAQAMKQIAKLSQETVDALCDDHLCVEIGIDFAVDRFFNPWPIDIEAKPKWGLLALARKQPDRWDDEVVAAYARPLRYLAQQ